MCAGEKVGQSMNPSWNYCNFWMQSAIFLGVKWKESTKKDAKLPSKDSLNVDSTHVSSQDGQQNNLLYLLPFLLGIMLTF